MFYYVFAADTSSATALNGLLELSAKYPWWQVLLLWVLLNIGSIVAWYGQRRHSQALKDIYTKYLSDKDKEIERQAARIKELENVLLKTKRK